MMKNQTSIRPGALRKGDRITSRSGMGACDLLFLGETSYATRTGGSYYWCNDNGRERWVFIADTITLTVER